MTSKFILSKYFALFCSIFRYSSEEEAEDLKDTAANIANKQKKDLARIDHNNITYVAFRKSFYVEVPEIAKMTDVEVDAYKVELEGIRVKGNYV